MEQDPALFEMFRREATERSAAITEGIEQLESGGADPTETIESLRREAHTLKGTAGVMGFDRLHELARLLEAALAEPGPAHRFEPAGAAKIRAGAQAFAEGAHAATTAQPEPPAVEQSIAELSQAGT